MGKLTKKLKTIMLFVFFLLMGASTGVFLNTQDVKALEDACGNWCVGSSCEDSWFATKCVYPHPSSPCSDTFSC